MKRLPLPDLLKGFAVFLIVPVHILETFIDFPGRENAFGKTLLFLGGPIAVPVFMMVMGYFLAKNQKPFATNFFRGIKIFFAGLLLNIGLNFHLLLKIQFAGWQLNPWEYIFGVDIFYFAGLAIIFLSVLKTLKTGREWIALMLVFAVAGATSFVNQKLMVPERNYIFPFIGGTWSWSYFPLFPWLAYPLAGFAFFHFEEKIMGFYQRQKILSGVFLTLILMVVLYFRKQGFETTINLPAYYHH
ncbi:MAG TPA: heparan-alpha-glucosaminide N-acetyltransferase domain-containing protein, partial [Draconibacterium sp.]|nr:heparan-alpha-glucosaminide N-acetyltransferase domain-containing protein [Draconibacterium sp.]